MPVVKIRHIRLASVTQYNFIIGKRRISGSLGGAGDSSSFRSSTVGPQVGG
jgi:hypothetical protein